MKKIYYILLFFAVMCFIGCKERADIDHPIAGHTYSSYTDTDYGYLISYAEFHVKGDFTMLHVKHSIYQGDESFWSRNKLWSVEGNDITIKNDNSSIFSSVRGKVTHTGFYNPTDSTVTLNNVVYEFLH